MFWHVPSRVLGSYAPDSLETSDPRTHVLSLRSYTAVEYKSQNNKILNIHHKLIGYTLQNFRIYITRFYHLHHKVLNIHHKIMNIHHIIFYLIK